MRHELIAAMLGTAIVISTPAYAQSATTFSYQGTLIEAGTPADGMYEFEVRLLDNLAVQIGLTETPVATVTEGVFQMDLDFGPAAFDGSQRFLEISVRSVMAGGAFTTLSPNHPVTSAPVAQFALEGNEGPVGPQGIQGNPGNDGNDGATGAQGNPGADGNDGAPGTEGAQGPQGTQGVQGDPGTPGDSHWLLNGSATYYNAGKVGIGTSSPVSPLHSVTTQTFRGAVRGDNNATSGLAYGIYGTSSSDEARGVFGESSSLSGETSGVYGVASSTEGRGVYGFASRLSGDNFGVKGLTVSPSGRGVYGEAFASSGTNFGVRGKTNSPDGYAGYFEGGSNYFQGNTGFGTSDPLFPIHVVSGDLRAIYVETSGVYGILSQSSSNGGHGIYGYATAPTSLSYGGQFVAESTTGTGVRGFAASTSGTNYGVYGQTSSNAGYAGYFQGGRNYFEGRVGVGTDSPSDKLHVNAPAGEDVFRAQTNGTTRIRVNALGGVALGGNSNTVADGNTYVVNNLGVGDSTPTNRVNVESSSSTLDGVRVSNGASNILLAPTRLRFAQNGELNAAGQLNINADSSAVVIEGTSFSSNDVTVGDDLFVSNDIIVSSQLTVGGAKAFTFDINCYGTAAKPGGGSWSVFSDQRLKKNITSMAGSLDTISALRPVNFEYKNDDHFSYLPGTQRGFIAQEVQQVIPQWVNTAKDGYLYLDQTGYEALIVDAIQELREEKDSQIKQLQTENKILQARLDRIEKALIILSNKN